MKLGVQPTSIRSCDVAAEITSSLMGAGITPTAEDVAGLGISIAMLVGMGWPPPHAVTFVMDLYIGGQLRGRQDLAHAIAAQPAGKPRRK